MQADDAISAGHLEADFSARGYDASPARREGTAARPRGVWPPKPRIVAIIEARMGSSRLPGKVLLPANGMPMIEHLVRRLRRVRILDAIVLATSEKPRDACLIETARRLGIMAFAGSEEDVMARVIGAAAAAAADVIVEITGDSPLIDPAIVEQVIQLYFEETCAYASNVQVRSYPRGMSVQVYSLNTLRRSAAITVDPADREHVTRHIRRHPEVFPHATVIAPADERWPELSLALDTADDYRRLKRIIEHFSTDSADAWRDILDLLRRNPELATPSEGLLSESNLQCAIPRQ